MELSHIRLFFNKLNADYLAVHKTKEDLFWATYMAVSDDHDGFQRAESAWKAWIGDASRLDAVRQHIEALEAFHGKREETEVLELLKGLRGWEAFLRTNILSSGESRAAMDKLVTLESKLFEQRQAYTMHHQGQDGHNENATLGMLATNLRTNPLESSRKSSFDALRNLETWILNHGYLDVIRARNELARTLGYQNYFDYKVKKSEAMSTSELFTILDDFEKRTRLASESALEEHRKKSGPDSLLPWNFTFSRSGDLARELDPYFPFSRGLERWIQSFKRLGIRFRSATLQLDLLERKGKYQNGFCHGPVPAFFDNGTWVPAAVNFTSEAKPGQIGSGQRALNTLFHEGGHAAHFANVCGNAPCFSQEFPPTSMAYAETQSMFCDSLLDDADWLLRYAKTEQGESMPEELIRKRIELSQPFAAFVERTMLVVPYFERDLYLLADHELTAPRVLELARTTERRILGMEHSRPVLSVPHLLNQESAASFHGYLLANMAVAQTRGWFLKQHGFITDNPAVGPLLAAHYWAPGNGRTHNETLIALTGEVFSSRYLAEVCTRTVEEAWQEAQKSMEHARDRASPDTDSSSLDARIRVVHGSKVLANNDISDAFMCETFASQVAAMARSEG